MQKSKGLKLNLEFDEDNKIVNSNLSISDKKNKIDKGYIFGELKKYGYAKFYIDEKALLELIKSATENKEIANIALAKAVDATMDIEFDNNNLNAFMILKPAYGGNDVTKEEVFNNIKEAGICYGLQNKAIIDLITKKSGKMCIAKGRPPIAGKDARIEKLINDPRNQGPFIGENGVADFYHQYEFIIIEPKTPLIKKISTTAGKAGYSVCGKGIEPEPGIDIKMPACGDGVEVSEKSDAILISSKTGHPVIKKDVVTVDPILTLADVGIRTGDVKFDGSVHIKGDVEIGMSVIATGDVIIEGSVHSANIEAEGEITINQGITGDDKQLEDSATIDTFTAHIKAKKDINANFASLANLETEGSIHLNEYAMQCLLKSDDKIFLGKDKGTGLLVGGECFAKLFVYCVTAGSEARVKTKINIGNIPKLRKKHLKFVELLDMRTQEIDSLKSVLTKIVAIPKSSANEDMQIKIKKIKMTIKAIQEKILKLQDKTELVLKEIKINKTAKIEVKDTIHPGVMINLNGKLTQVGKY